MANAILIKSKSAGLLDNKGEIFNDYENNIAQGEYSSAFGTKTIAGLKGYYYYDIDFSSSNPVIKLTKEQGLEGSSFEVDYAVGDIISLVNGTKYPNCATIIDINNNIITVDSLPFTEIDWDTGIDDNSFYVISKPTVGECALGSYAHAEGDRA